MGFRKGKHSAKLTSLGRLASSNKWLNAAGTAIVSTAANAMDVVDTAINSADEEIKDVKISKLKGLKDLEGQKLNLGSIYAEHPILMRKYISASLLHNYVLKEQRAHIIRYFRSSVALKRLTIEIVSQKSGNFYAGGGWKTVSAEAGKNANEEHRCWFTVTYNEPRKEDAQLLENLFWMPYFDEIAAATRGASGGTIQSETTINTSFGISAKAAKLANIDGNWISQQSFVVKAEYD